MPCERQARTGLRIFSQFGVCDTTYRPTYTIKVVDPAKLIMNDNNEYY